VPTGIIAFAKDWNEDPTSNHHVLRELAKTRRVLWLNSLATRTPNLSSARDLGKLRRKLGEFARGPVRVENDLWVFTPLVLPLPHLAAARAVNRLALRVTLGALRWRLGLSDFHLWTFLPNVADYLGVLGEQLSVYYCVDEWSMFSYLDRDRTVELERRLLTKVDAVFAINHALADTKRSINAATFVSPHGVDVDLFGRALSDDTVVPADLAAIKASHPGPVIGFYGTLQDWVDLELIESVARARPDWSIVLIGQILIDVERLRTIENVHLLGRRAHQELPAYCKGFDVGIIPYRRQARMEFVNPIKLREYLAAGLPVVSTSVPEVVRYGARCAIADSPEDFVVAIEAATTGIGTATNLEHRRTRAAAMANESWSARVAEVARVVEQIAESKRSSKR
jgi:glycosyltransferase involved in cell wall biosynthesis